MSSPNRSTSDIEDTFSSMNILNYISVSSDYFPASARSSSFNYSENSTDNMIPSVFSSFYNNPCLKDVQAFYAKELPISSPDPITPPAILTPSLVLPPSLLFDPRYFFIPEELLPPKKRIHSPSSSSTIMPPKRTSTSETPAITLAAIQQLINDGISSALKAQAASMVSDSNPNRNIGPTGLLRIPRISPSLCPNMVPNAEKLMEVFINGLPRSIEGNVTASKSQTLEEAINITQRLMDQIIKHDSVQEANNRKRK
ncbi:hypothetical protein Tco_1473954 [Tanacetum coccineum]